MRLFLLVLAVAGLGCAGAPPAASGDALAGTTWRLVQIGTDGLADADATLTFSADGTVSGSTGCNRFTGSYTLQPDGALAFSPLATTRRACAPGVGDQERRVLDALGSVAAAETDGAALALLSEGGAPLLTYVDAASVTGVVTYRPRIALPPDAVLTVRLLDTSRADAPPVALAEQTVALSGRQVPVPFALTYDADAIQESDRYAVHAEIRAADDAPLWTTDTTVPVLTRDAPHHGIEIVLAPVQHRAATLVGPTWSLATIERANGVTLVMEPGPAYALTFGAEGRYGGQADCNRYGGAYEATGAGGLAVRPGPATLAACASPSASEEYLAVLLAVESYRIGDGQLVLSTGAGDALTFTWREAAFDGMMPHRVGETLTCETADGEVRLRTGPGEIALWLPDGLAERAGGDYHVLAQVRADSGTAFRDGTLEVRRSPTGAIRLRIAGREIACAGGSLRRG